MTKLYSSPAAKAKWEALRTTPRGRGLVLARVVDPGRIDIKKRPLRSRAERREEPRRLFALGLLKNAELGIDPIYLNRNGAARLYDFDNLDPFTSPTKAWKKRAKAWDVAHQPKPEAEAA